MSRISVVIPVYNGAEFLEECLKSVKNQTLADFRAIIVNDASTDGSLAIATAFAESDERFEIIDSADNRGLSGARNLGVSKVKTEFVTFLDADDALYPQALELMLGKMEEYKGDLCRVNSSRGDEFFPRLYHDITVRRFSYEEAMREALYQKTLMNSACGALLKSEILKEEGGFRQGIWYEDLDSFYRFARYAKKVVYIEQPLYFYRDNPHSFINTWSDGRLDVLDVTDRMERFFADNYPDLLPAAADRRFSAHYNIMMLLLKNNVDNPVAMRRCMERIREGRLQALLDVNVRLKNKLGALLSYGGIPAMKLASKIL